MSKNSFLNSNTFKKWALILSSLPLLVLFQNFSPAPGSTNVTVSNAVSCKVTAAGVINPALNCIPAAACDGTTDDTNAFTSAMAVLNSSGGTLEFPSRTCIVNKTLEIKRSQIGMVCAGGDMSCIVKMAATNIPQISATQLFPGVENINIRGLYLQRSSGAVDGGDAINFSGWVNGSTIDSVKLEGSYNNIVLGPTSISRARNLLLANAVKDNLVMKTNSGQWGATLQWDLDAIGLGGAGRFGIYVTNVGTTEPYTILGDWRNIQTYLNQQGSIWIEGSPGHSINDLRLDRGWICCSTQGVGAYEMYFNMAGGENNSISNTTVEIGNGIGIAVDGSTKQFSISNTRVNGCAGEGILGGATQQFSLDHVSVIANGLKRAASGISLYAPITTISNVMSKGNSQYGIVLNAGQLMATTGDLTGNSAGALGGIANTSNTRVCSMLGVNGFCK